MTHEILFEKLAGKWSGQCKTWFEPEVLADESDVSGEFSPVLGGRFVRHIYSGSMKGKPRHGEELVSYNRVTKNYQISWVDDFHMNYAILFSEGVPATNGFTVSGKYDVGDGHPQWGWRTQYELVSDDELRITAWNITADGEESKAVETVYHRVAEK